MRAGKTFAILQYLISLVEQRADLTVTVCSNTLPALRIGAMRDFQQILKATDHWIYFDENKTTHTFTCKATGSKIEFLGLDEDLKARGAARDILFINEANRIKWDVFEQLAKQNKNIHFKGRLGNYKYYDMDDTINNALQFVEEQKANI